MSSFIRQGINALPNESNTLWALAQIKKLKVLSYIFVMYLAILDKKSQVHIADLA